MGGNAGNAGEVRLDVVAMGRDELSAMVNTVNGQLDQMRAQLGKLGAAQASQADNVDRGTAALKGQIEALTRQQSTLRALGQAGPAQAENEKKLAGLVEQHTAALNKQIAAHQRVLAIAREAGVLDKESQAAHEQKIRALASERDAMSRLADTTEGMAGKAETAKDAHLGMVEGVKEGIKPLNQTRELIEQVRGNFNLIEGVVIAVGAGFMALWEVLSKSRIPAVVEEARKAVESFDRLGKATGDLLRTARDTSVGLGELRGQLYQVAAANAEAAGDSARAEWLMAKSGIEATTKAVEDQQKAIDDTFSTTKKLYGAHTEVTTALRDAAAVQDQLTQKMKEAEAISSPAKREKAIAALAEPMGQVALRVGILRGQEAMLSSEIDKGNASYALRTQVLEEMNKRLADQEAIANGSKIVLDETTVTPNRGGGGGAKSDADEMAKRMAESQTQIMNELAALERQNVVDLWEFKRKKELAEQEEQAARVAQRVAWIEEERAAEFKRLDDVAKWEKELADERKEYDSQQKEIFAGRVRGFTDVINTFGDAVETKLPGAKKQFADLTRIWSGIEKSSKGLASGIIGSIDSILTSGAEWFKSEKDKTLFLAGKEAALAVATAFINPGEAASHGVASAMLFALAGRGGGGAASASGGARGASHGGSDGSAQGGGGGTTILNFNTLTTDKQSVDRAVQEAAWGGRNTGYRSRRGA